MISEDVFEILDFTNATEVEQLVSLIEQVVVEWKPLRFKGNTRTSICYCKCRESIDYGNQCIQISHFCSDVERSTDDSGEDAVGRYESFVKLLMSSGSDFPVRAHCLTRWFGIVDFIHLCASANVSRESDIQTLLSIVSCVSSNLDVEVPMLVNLLEPYRQYYRGFFFHANELVSKFDMIHLSTCPQQLKNLSGLLRMFRERLSLECEDSLQVSVNFTYALYDWTEFTDYQPLPDLQGDGEIISSLESLFSLPVGTFDDPVCEIQLSAIWKGLSAYVIEENSSYTDLTPLNAPSWSVRVRMAESPNCILGQHLMNFVRASTKDKAIPERKRRVETKANDAREYADALGRLTGDASLSFLPDFSNVLSSASKRFHPIFSTTVSDELCQQLIEKLFSDSLILDEYSEPDQISCSMKSCPPGCILLDLSWLLCSVNFNGAATGPMLSLWRCFVAKVRQLYDEVTLIPTVSQDRPDTTQCLLYQKLQLLNCCIKRRIDRETSVLDASESTEVFFECEDDGIVNEDMQGDWDDEFSTDRSDATGWESGWDEQELDLPLDDDYSATLVPSDRKPEGRLKEAQGMSLLNHPTRPLYIPITQEQPPMTEDMIEEQATFLEQLGDDRDGSELRMLIQSRNLVSDMEAFKAANPGCVLEDFIRWYSPRDWSEVEGLSSRMMVPGNTWQSSWTNSLPVPVARQKRIFDDTKEAEKVFTYLDSLSAGQICQHLLSSLIHRIVLKLLEGTNPYTQQLREQLLATTKSTRFKSDDLSSVEEIVKLIFSLETVMSRAASLRKKFCHLSSEDAPGQAIYEEFVDQLLASAVVPVVGASRGPVGGVICRLFALAHNISKGEDYSYHSTSDLVSDDVFPPPVGKEYIIRGTTLDPYSQLPMPHRMYTVITEDEFRVAFCQTESTRI